jgi:hypothetical protein
MISHGNFSFYLDRAHKDRNAGDLISVPLEKVANKGRTQSQWTLSMRNGCLEDLINNRRRLFHIELGTVKKPASGLGESGLKQIYRCGHSKEKGERYAVVPAAVHLVRRNGDCKLFGGDALT